VGLGAAGALAVPPVRTVVLDVGREPAVSDLRVSGDAELSEHRVIGPAELAAGMERNGHGRAAPRSNADELTDAFLPPRLPEGRYVVQSMRADVRKMFERRVLCLECAVVEPRQFDGTPLTWYAPLPSGRRYPVASKFLRAWVLVMGRRPGRGEHPAVRDLVGKRWVAIVETVTTSWERDEHRRPVALPPEAQYSVIRSLVGRA
jgi:hypothetical protein